jgi:hypothetical protein
MPDRRGWSPKRNTPGYVYILQGDNGLYKIGSTNRLDRRIWEVSHYSGVRCELYYSVETANMNELEKKLHKQFKDMRVYGEWFDLNPLELAGAVMAMHKGEPVNVRT